MSTRSDRLAISVLIALFIGISIAYSVVNPPFEATDELRHYRYVRVLVESGNLPVQGQERCRSQSHHPPLFYWLGALATSTIDTGKDLCDEPERNPFWAYRFSDVGTDNKNQYFFDHRAPPSMERLTVLLIRWINVTIGAATVWLTWKIGRMLHPQNSAVAIAAAAIVAFNPMFAFMSAAINNDIMAALTSTFVLYCCLRYFQQGPGNPWRWGVRFGLAFGLALLSKFNNLPLFVLISAELLYTTIRDRNWGQWLKLNAAFITTTSLISGWWFVRNQQLYGEPTGVRILTELWGVRAPADSFDVAISELPQVWSSLWGRFGYGQIPLPNPIYAFLLVFVLIGFVAAMVHGFKRWRSSGFNALFELLIPLAFVATFAAVVFNYMLISPAGAMGRFFFPGFPALALLVAIGWSTLSRLKRAPAPAIRIGFPLLILTLVALISYLRPAYAYPSGVPATVPNSDMQAEVAGLGRLIGFELSAGEVQPGGTLTLDLYWQIDQRPIGNFVMFTHLIDEAGFVTQRDTHPGTGAFPSGFWREGDEFVDSITLHIPDVAMESDSAELSIGFYARDEGYRLQFQSPNGDPLGDAYSLGSISIIEPVKRPSQNFGNAIAMLDYQVTNRIVDIDSEFTVSIRWEALIEGLTNYEVQLLLLDENEAYRGSVDINPSTDKWHRGDINTTIHTFKIDQLPVPLEPGEHILRLAVQDRKTSIKAMHLATSGTEIDDFLDLAPIRIVTP